MGERVTEPKGGGRGSKVRRLVRWCSRCRKRSKQMWVQNGLMRRGFGYGNIIVVPRGMFRGLFVVRGVAVNKLSASCLALRVHVMCS